jgi:tetratricopeptide (TPR) repeat protein
MVAKVMTMSLLKNIAPLLAKNTAIINLKHLAASDKDIAALQGEWVILKPNDGTRAFGIVVLPKKFLIATLEYLAGDDAGKNIPDYFKHASRKKLLEKLHELYKECHGFKGYMLIAQKYVPPLAIELSGKKYSATLRVVVAACLDTASKQIELQYIGAFNKLAVNPITQKGFDWDERISSSMLNQDVNQHVGADQVEKNYVLASKQASPIAVAVTPIQQEIIENKFIPAIRPVMEYLLNKRAADHFIAALEETDTAASLFYRDMIHLFPLAELTQQDCYAFAKHRLNLPLIILYSLYRKINIIQDIDGDILSIKKLLELLKIYNRDHSKDMSETEKAKCYDLAGELIESLSLINRLLGKNLDLSGLNYCLKLDNPSYLSGTDNIDAMMKQAARDFQQEQFLKAYNTYNTIIHSTENTTKKATCYYNMASCQARMHHFSKAIEFCQIAANLRAEDSDSAPTIQKTNAKLTQLRLMLCATNEAKIGLEDFKAQKFSAARDHFITAVELTEKSTLAKDLLGTYYYNLASCHAHLGTYDKAIKACQLSVEIRKAEFGDIHKQTLSSKEKLQKLQETAAEVNKQEVEFDASCQTARPF